MTSRLVPTLQEILYRLVGAASAASQQQVRSTKPGRFPVVVRAETRAFLEAQAEFLGGSIAGVAGAILDGVAMATLGGAGALRGVAERFNILIAEHELSVPGAADALSDLGLSLADFASVEALQLKLTSSTLRDVAHRFHVNYDWLSGQSEEVFSSTANAWYKAVGAAAGRLLEAKRSCVHAELTLYLRQGSDLEVLDDERGLSSLPHFIPVLKRTSELSGGEVLNTYEVWDEGRWSHWRCREHIKLVVYFAHRLGIQVSGRQLPPTDYDLLVQGRALPATLLRRNPGAATWHPDDYVLPNSAVAKAPEEWQSILARPEYADTVAHFNDVLAREGGRP